MQIRINQEIFEAIQEIKNTLSENKNLTDEDLEVLFLTSLLEEES